MQTIQTQPKYFLWVYPNRMITNNKEKLFISFPVMIVFFFSLLKTFQNTQYPYIQRVVFTIFTLQIITHIVQLFTGFKCTPSEKNPINKICNIIALVFGVTLLSLLSFVFYHERIKITLFSILVALYMTVSHVIHLRPLRTILTCCKGSII